MKCQTPETDIEITITIPHIHGIQPLLPRPDPVSCNIRPECAACGYPAHGFLCHFEGGSCLRYPDQPMTDQLKDNSMQKG